MTSALARFPGNDPTCTANVLGSLMKHKPFHLILMISVALSGGLAYGQGSPGAIVKKPRTLQDYKPATLKEIGTMDSDVANPRDQETRLGKDAGLLPFRVRVVFTAFTKPISATSNDVLEDWARCCAGNPDHYTKTYANEMQFVENGAAYWLAVQDRLVADFQRDLRVGEAIDLFLIRISARGDDGNRSSALLVEGFQKAVPNSDQAKESLDWIRNNLPSFAEKDLKVEVPARCQLKITDSSNSTSLSKAVVFVPLTDLDPMKVRVLWRQGRDTSELELSTTASKRSILFMLYQGGPAEGGQASKYSLTVRDREKAEAMAEAFRRAINLCAGGTDPKVK